MLRQSKLYKGFVIEKHCFKFSLFAHDTAIYLNGNHLQFKYVFDILETFGSKQGWKPKPKPKPKPENPVLKEILETQTETDTYSAKSLKT